MRTVSLLAQKRVVTILIHLVKMKVSDSDIADSDI